MRLYLRHDLMKSESAEEKKPAKDTSGSLRGGAYVARAQVGLEKDGSPKYRYFKTQEEYNNYLKGQGASEGAKDLENKVKKEHKQSTDKQHKPGLLSKDKAVSKGLRLFVRI